MKKQKSSNVPVFFRLLGKLFRIAPVKFSGIYLCFLANGLVFGGIIKLKQVIFDNAPGYVQGNVSLRMMIFLIASLLVVEVVSIVLSFGGSFIAENFDIIAKGVLKREVFEKIDKLPALNFENPKLLDSIEKSHEGIEAGISFVNGLLDLFFMYLPTIVVFGVYLFTIKPILLIVLLLIFVPVVFSQFVKAKIHGELEETIAPLRRKHKYFIQAAVGRDYFKETRVLGTFSYFKSLATEVLASIQGKRMGAVLKNNRYELTSRLISLLGYLGILILLFELLTRDEISVGAFVAIFSSIGEMYDFMEDAIVTRMGTYAMNYGKIRNYYQLLDMDEDVYEMQRGSDESIRLKNLQFRYPQAEHQALTDINLEIKKGDIVAIVGENGSGKTTLAKILCGLYKPTSGNIQNGVLEEGQQASQVFQRFNRYKLSLRENIWISESLESASQDRIEKAVGDAQLQMKDKSFPNGYDTILSNEYGGVDLSGGQWQKIATARAFYMNSDYVILDEPTAAIDPIEEEASYERFYKLLQGKTGVIITHRMGAVRYANKIIVMDGGKIMAFGPHSELVTASPMYSKMWESQKAHYK